MVRHCCRVQRTGFGPLSGGGGMSAGVKTLGIGFPLRTKLLSRRVSSNFTTTPVASPAGNSGLPDEILLGIPEREPTGDLRVSRCLDHSGPAPSEHWRILLVAQN